MVTVTLKAVQKGVLTFSFLFVRRLAHAPYTGTVCIDQNKYGYNGITRSHQYPGHLLVVDQFCHFIDKRQGKCCNDHTCRNRKHHTDVADNVPLSSVTAHE